MARVLTCDHCHEVISDGQSGAVLIDVTKGSATKPDAKMITARDFLVHLDLHIRCYDEVYRATLEAER